MEDSASGSYTYGKSGEVGTLLRLEMKVGLWINLLANGTLEKKTSTRWNRVTGGGILRGQVFIVNSNDSGDSSCGIASVGL